MEETKNKPVIIWLLSGCLLIFLMVIVGGITRLTNSGLSMVDWKLIMGVIPPIGDEAWQKTFEQYQKFPEYQMVNYHFTLSEFKSIFFWEYFHRLLGRLIGLVFIIPFLYFLLKKKLSKKLTLQCLIILGMGALQGAIGWWMVKSGLVKDPDVSHFRLATHLITAFLTFAYTFWVALNLIYPKNSSNYKGLRRVIYLLFGITILQIIYGAFVAGLNAGFILNTWPKMGGEWISESVFAIKPIWLSLIEGLAGVQFVHRYLAYFVVSIVAYLWFKTRKMEVSIIQKQGVNILLIAVLFQFVLGVFTLLFSVPIWLGVTHQLGAFLLLTAVVFVMNTFKKNS
ncbi:heme A synthase [Vicingus serpentipes]|uniref:Heme A synthase n=1 Tax=Vicingus serpentipes TaxID=1926625 RepID=A0A5C6RU06_9FLAO|nr:COX15/CtaA family protein [Vicingus serpentipes]TXB65788.1 heme A synthase [Vicingus serpentipes]